MTLKLSTLQTTTFVTGYWRINKNQKKSPLHYKMILPKTMRIVRGGNLVVFYNETEFFDLCVEAAKQYNVHILGRYLPAEQLPYFQLGEQLLASAKGMKVALNENPKLYQKDRGARLHSRVLRESGDDAYRTLISIWNSKIPLVNQLVIPENPFATSLFAWMDLSVSRFNYIRQNWNFTRQIYSPDAIYHYGTKSWFQGQKMQLNASFYLGDARAWAKFDHLFEHYLKKHVYDCYAHDDETIVYQLMQDHPDLFISLGKIRNPHLRQAIEFRNKVEFRLRRLFHASP